jgi:hypothetical protein
LGNLRQGTDRTGKTTPSSIQPTGDKPTKSAKEATKPRKSQATLLVEQVQGTDWSHDAEGIAYAVLTANGHREHWPIRSRAFRDWLCRRFWQAQRQGS